MKAEPALQHSFMIGAIILVASLLSFQAGLNLFPDRSVVGPATAAVRYIPVDLARASLGSSARINAWHVVSDDRRFGGISGLAIDSDGLVAISDWGLIARLPFPGSGGEIVFVDLPAGPGDGGFKYNRDSEAIVRDGDGRGWWVAFENRDELWLYDDEFRRPLRRVGIRGQNWPINTGIEALAVSGGDMLAFVEPGHQALVIRDGRLRTEAISPARGRISDAVALADGSVLVVERRPTLRGFANALVRLERKAGGFRATERLRLPLGALDNVEALAVQRSLGSGATLWLMTDDNGQRPMRTLLIRIDVKPRDRRGVAA